MTAAAHLQPRQFVARMAPSELLPHVEGYRTGTGEGQRHVDTLAQSINAQGYQPRRHGGMSGDTRTSPPSAPITLVHENAGSYLLEGNHRVAALNQAAYPKKVPVLVKDYRRT